MSEPLIYKWHTIIVYMVCHLEMKGVDIHLAYVHVSALVVDAL